MSEDPKVTRLTKILGEAASIEDFSYRKDQEQFETLIKRCTQLIALSLFWGFCTLAGAIVFGLCFIGYSIRP